MEQWHFLDSSTCHFCMSAFDTLILNLAHWFLTLSEDGGESRNMKQMAFAISQAQMLQSLRLVLLIARRHHEHLRHMAVRL